MSWKDEKHYRGAECCGTCRHFATSWPHTSMCYGDCQRQSAENPSDCMVGMNHVCDDYEREEQ